MKRVILGTGVWSDFPTIKGIIYPKDVLESIIYNESIRNRLSNGNMVGGILSQSNTIKPLNGVTTHVVTDIQLYKGEVVVEIEYLDIEMVHKHITTPEAAVIFKCPMDQPNYFGVINKIEDIYTVHIRERRSI